MSRYKKQIWSGEGPEPFAFAYTTDPGHVVDPMTGCDEQANFINHMVTTLNNWLNDQKVPVDAITARLKAEWQGKGGALFLWGGMLQQAFLRSRYYKAMLSK